ncbi:hypothetical protein OF83DRAFT_1052744 [Amylostereum chailletii]|nr:hypothetical protein OF83DRAFT_1052744 [Amylostereum chailletii]
MAYATGYPPDAENVIRPGAITHESSEPIQTYTSGPFVLSDDALRSAERALFGHERMAKDRIHWRFPHEKDARVRGIMEWIKTVSDGLGALGLNHFLQDGERGALFVNAEFNPSGYREPILQWLLYQDVVSTKEKKIQESVGFYNPSIEAIVFVILPSQTGNSAAIWRRKVSIPDHVRMTHSREIGNVLARLKTDYPVYVDELSYVLSPSLYTGLI